MMLLLLLLLHRVLRLRATSTENSSAVKREKKQFKNNKRHTVVRDNGKRMSDQCGIDGFHVRPVEIRMLHVIQQRVTPIKSVGHKIDGQTVRPPQCDVAEHDQIRTVGVRTANVRGSIPFGEEYISGVGENNAFIDDIV